VDRSGRPRRSWCHRSPCLSRGAGRHHPRCPQWRPATHVRGRSGSPDTAARGSDRLAHSPMLARPALSRRSRAALRRMAAATRAGGPVMIARARPGLSVRRSGVALLVEAPGRLPGSRRWASSKTRLTTAAASSTTLATSHLLRARGAGPRGLLSGPCYLAPAERSQPARDMPTPPDSLCRGRGDFVEGKGVLSSYAATDGGGRPRHADLGPDRGAQSRVLVRFLLDAQPPHSPRRLRLPTGPAWVLQQARNLVCKLRRAPPPPGSCSAIIGSISARLGRRA
jgi:hypothetical protein